MTTPTRTRNQACRAAIIAATIAVLAAPGAFAGGLEVPDLGTVAIGRGTAFVARADNLSAFYYNPAGLSKSTGPDLLLGANLVNLNVKYLRTGGDRMEINGYAVGNPDQDYSEYVPIGDDANEPQPYSSVSSSSKIGPAPMLVFNWGDAFHVEGLALSIGLVPPSSFGTPSYPENGPQRYALREAHFLMMFPGVGVAYKFNRYIQVGGVFLSGMAFLKQNLAIRPLPVLNDPLREQENMGGDADLGVDVKDLFMPTGILGVMSNPVDWLEIGATVKFPTKVEATGKAKYTAPEIDLPDSRFMPGEDKVTLRQTFPWVVRIGARYIHRYFDIEADFVWENWSALKEFEIDMDATLNQEYPDGALVDMPDSAIPKNFRDTYSARLGGDVEVWPEHIALRVGGYYQSSAYPENYDTFSLDFPFGEQIGVGGGLTWHAASWLDLNVGYLHVFQIDVEVDEGILQQQGLPYYPDPSNPDDPVQVGNTVNNGSYEVSLNLFGLSLEGHF